MTKKTKFRCTNCYGFEITILKHTDCFGILKPIGICQRCGKRKDLDQTFLHLANQFFDHNEAEKLLKIKRTSSHYMKLKNKNKRKSKRGVCNGKNNYR